MSSHREAPEIAKDPVADSTDLYAFVSPDESSTVTIVANYIPLEGPAAGPNFYEFGDDVLYEIHVDNNGDGVADVTYQFTFTTVNTIPSTFLYNVGPIESLTSQYWNRRQTYTVTRVDGHGRAQVLDTGVPCPPCNIGPLSTPNYASLAALAVRPLPGGRMVFAGQRAEAFYVDLGAVFDLGDLRPLANLHATFGLPGLSASSGVNATASVNVHSIALQVPITDIAPNGVAPTDPSATASSVGIWTSASRQKARIIDANGGAGQEAGPWVQVSRLGNPLFNELLVPIPLKDKWNAQPPAYDSNFAAGVAHPELAGLLNVLYPGYFPNVSGYAPARADLEAILLTGIPKGIISPTFSTFTGTTKADMLRLNLAIPPTSSPKVLGLLAGDVAGFPNGRRLVDDVVSIELLAVAGATIPLVDSTFTVDAAVADISTGVTNAGLSYLTSFPYMGTPYSGWDVPA
ncbi:MAG TPA: DUF4331 domain-containing protein [Acidimicrobiales bacterium]|nr:DUF4331 domain-containing protein [Acidimicrobiales bacterium]